MCVRSLVRLSEAGSCLRGCLQTIRANSQEPKQKYALCSRARFDMPIEAAARKAYLLGTQTLNLVCLKLFCVQS